LLRRFAPRNDILNTICSSVIVLQSLREAKRRSNPEMSLLVRNKFIILQTVTPRSLKLVWRMISVELRYISTKEKLSIKALIPNWKFTQL